MSPAMLKSDASPARKTTSAPDRNPVAKDNKRTQVVAGFFRQREPAELVAEPVIDQTPSQDAEPAAEPLRSSAAAHGAGEIELKLLVDAGRMAHFNAAPVIAANARNKGTRKHLKSAYYDTPE
jgi:triphosphatase